MAIIFTIVYFFAVFQTCSSIDIPILSPVLSRAYKEATNVVSKVTNCDLAEERCPNKDITFWLYTKDLQTPHQINASNPASINNAPFIKNASIFIIIHGFTGNKDASPNEQIRPELLQHGHHNIISVDYGPLVPDNCYLSAVQNLNVVGNCTAQLIDVLVEKMNVPLHKFHLIGFSLGAHVTGFVSEHLQSGKLHRITGLDPAFPLFITELNRKLSPADAHFVDVVHTSGLKTGKLLPMGTADFYANGGIDQPGCLRLNPLELFSCDHDRAVDYYAESIRSDKGFWGKRCKALKLDCEEKDVQLMGFYVSTLVKGTYFFETNEKFPFARGR